MRSQEDGSLVSLSLQQFVRSVGARTAAPGGGSVSAAVAALVQNKHLRLIIINNEYENIFDNSVDVCCRGQRWAPWWAR